jgi:hypothetical protein
MFNTFKKEGEEITEPAKVRILLNKVEHPQLQNAVSALRIRAQMVNISLCLTERFRLPTVTRKPT